MVRGRIFPPLLLAGCLVCGAASEGADAGTAKRRALDERPASPSALAPERLLLPGHVDVEPIRAGDLLPAGGATISFDGARGAVAGLRTRVLRRLDGLWRFDVPAERTTDAALQVEYELRGADGRRDALSLPDADGAWIPVRLQPVGPRLLRSWNGRSWLEGGVILDLDLEDVRHAGTYRGTLFVTVSRL